MTGRRIQQERWRSDWPLAQQMAEQGKTLDQIVAALPGRTIDQVRWKFVKEGKQAPRRDPWVRGGVRLDRRQPATESESECRSRAHPEAMTHRVSPQQAAERDARYAASLLRTQTQEFFGDPPPGFSHLDKVRSVASASHPNQNNETQ